MGPPQEEYKKSSTRAMHIFFNLNERAYQLEYGIVYPAEGGYAVRPLIDSEPTLAGLARKLVARSRPLLAEDLDQGPVTVFNRPGYSAVNIVLGANEAICKRPLDAKEFDELEKLLQEEMKKPRPQPD